MKFLTFIFFFISSSVLHSQNLSPLEITQKFFGKDGFPEKNKYLCCDMKEDIKSDSTIGQQMPDSVEREFEVLYQDSIEAVTAVNLSLGKHKENWYIFFKKDTEWKIQAMRALAMTGFAAKILEQYENVSEDSLRKLDSLMLKATDTVPSKRINIRKFIMQCRLELFSDKELIQYFLDNKPAFTRLLNIYFEKFKGSENAQENFCKDPDIIKALDSLNLHMFTYESRFESGTAENCFMIGGMLDNTFGFFYEKDKNKIPKIKKSGFIMIREIGDGWYLYKTT
ncbi:MAG: hypothetical protein JSS63_08655 [Bacteroidetes bacterium]|nr:hypothetical protein [Bacteroidota bacterium]